MQDKQKYLFDLNAGQEKVPSSDALLFEMQTGTRYSKTEPLGNYVREISSELWNLRKQNDELKR
jgi:hypothetical protein